MFSSFLIARCFAALRSWFVASLACFNLLSNIVPEHLLNSSVVYLLWLGILFSISEIFGMQSASLTKSLL